jgi:xanthine/CO dehydrogenase XdhC/CoxF family maturation factor
VITYEVALTTVVRTWGSSPRPAGSKLAVNDATEFVGSVSGGCIEGAVIHEALEVMASGASGVLAFGVSDETAWEPARADRAAYRSVDPAPLAPTVRQVPCATAARGSGAPPVVPAWSTSSR